MHFGFSGLLQCAIQMQNFTIFRTIIVTIDSSRNSVILIDSVIYPRRVVVSVLLLRCRYSLMYRYSGEMCVKQWI